MERGPQALRREPRDARHGREDPPRLRRRRGGARAVGRRPGRARRRRLPAPAPLRRAPRRDRPRGGPHPVATVGRAQVRLDPRVLSTHGRTRTAVPEPRRPRLPCPPPAAAAQAAPHGRGDDTARSHTCSHPAGDARPRDARADLLVRPALRGGREPRRRRPRFRRRGAARHRKGLEDPDRAGGGARPAGPRALSRDRAPGAACPGGAPRSRRCSFPSEAAACRPRTFAAACACGCETPASPQAPRHIRCGIPSPPTCWRAEQTCARSRSFWATAASPLPRSTLG